ncbi:MAG: cyanobactin biosynthesis system PatB/AcyB/McaB family protein [Gemmatimonadales bacterium]|nr:cyanobactin biosynthesis system PatB/AcyB/McaB family protein [Gemmatimonadales bacterium]
MRLPLQSPPVRRPELIHPHRTVDLVHGTPEELVTLRISLMHGANYNDPQSFTAPGMPGQSDAFGGFS